MCSFNIIIDFDIQIENMIGKQNFAKKDIS